MKGGRLMAAALLPARPSLESLRKKAKQLARAVAAGGAAAIARARVHIPVAEPLLTQREAQLVIAREYGFAGWQELKSEIGWRLGAGREWAAQQAERVIHDNDVEGLQKLLAEYPTLLSPRADDEDDSLLAMATSAYGDAGDAEREGWVVAPLPTQGRVARHAAVPRRARRSTRLLHAHRGC
jgi:hypothetical protein